MMTMLGGAAAARAGTRTRRKRLNKMNKMERKDRRGWQAAYLPNNTICQSSRSSQSAKEASPSPGGEGWGEGEPFSGFSAVAVRSRCARWQERKKVLQITGK